MAGTNSGPEKNAAEESSDSHSTTDPKVDQTKDSTESQESDSIKNKVTEPKSNKRNKMSLLEPPTFISDDKPFDVYKKDLLRWSRLTSLDKTLQAEMIVYKLENHPSRIQEKISTQLGDKLVDNDKGIDVLLEFLEEIYKKDSMADAWDKYSTCENFKFDNKISLKQFIVDWENQYHKLKNVGCAYSNLILAFKLLDS